MGSKSNGTTQTNSTLTMHTRPAIQTNPNSCYIQIEQTRTDNLGSHKHCFTITWKPTDLESEWKIWYLGGAWSNNCWGGQRLNRKTGFDFLPQFLPIKMSGSWQIWRLLVRLKKLHSQERLGLIETGRKTLPPPIHDKFSLKLVTNFEKCVKFNPRRNTQRKPAPWALTN